MAGEVGRMAEGIVFLDTNIIVKFYTRGLGSLTRDAARLMESHDLVITPAVWLELQYLSEIRRIKFAPTEALDELRSGVGLTLSDSLYKHVVETACTIGWTRDTFDRLIVADAMLCDAPLVTADAHILQHYPKALW